MTVAAPAALVRPNVTFWNIWNMCFGFFGIQFGFQLQNANVSRIFMTLGADPNSVSALWIAAPLTGLIVQPIIGYLSDRTWTWLGRRRPYFLAGAVLATLALFAMPRSPTLWIAAGMLWVLDASINIAMEPFRAFVADQLPESQRAAGYTMQSFFIGAGAVVAGVLPWLFDHFGVSNVGNTHSAIPDTVRYAFDAGAVVLLVAILWTVMTSREYPPTVPLQRYGTEAEISAAIVFLMSPAAAYITGSCIRVDGGAPNARGTWKLQAHQNSKPFMGFHRATLPEMLKASKP